MNENTSVKNTLDNIPEVQADAKRITALVKENGKVTGYRLSDNSVVNKDDAVKMAENGKISGVGIAHNGDTRYLKAIPNDNENDNLSNLPSISPEE